jgi:hypothetical protein
MTPERPNEDLRAVWQTETSGTARLNHVEIRRIVDEMERKMRRSRIDFIAAVVSVSVAIIVIAVLFPEPLLTLGTVVMLAGFAVLIREVFQQWRRAPVVENGGATSVEYHRALLQHRLEFHRKLWLRVLCLTPGGVLFFLGFAAARPDLAAWIYAQLATFLVVVMAIVPVNRKAAVKLEHQIADLENLLKEKPVSTMAGT